MTLKKINILEYAFGEGGGGHQKAYAVYAFINVDNCERPLKCVANGSDTNMRFEIHRYYVYAVVELSHRCKIE